tara:strand:+ start:1701 stop:2462 length:762 start_codon:yes stop_codon:yes gene_type:complete
MEVPFWYNDPLVLINYNSLFEIVPLKSYSYNRKLNAIMRLTIVYSIIVFILNNNSSIFCLPFVTILITVYLYKYPMNNDSKKNKVDTTLESFVNNNKIKSNSINLSEKNLNNIVDSDIFIDCNNIDTTIYRKPTVDNPMMNLNLITGTSNGIHGDTLQAIPTFDNVCVADLVDEKLNFGLYRDPNDIWGTRNSNRQFYTMPNTTVNNHEVELGKWLYGTPPTCKEGNGLQCSANIPSLIELGHMSEWLQSSGK